VPFGRRQRIRAPLADTGAVEALMGLLQALSSGARLRGAFRVHDLAGRIEDRLCSRRRIDSRRTAGPGAQALAATEGRTKVERHPLIQLQLVRRDFVGDRQVEHDAAAEPVGLARAEAERVGDSQPRGGGEGRLELRAEPSRVSGQGAAEDARDQVGGHQTLRREHRGPDLRRDAVGHGELHEKGPRIRGVVEGRHERRGPSPDLSRRHRHVREPALVVQLERVNALEEIDQLFWSHRVFTVARRTVRAAWARRREERYKLA
jgi:hypothetical protein